MCVHAHVCIYVMHVYRYISVLCIHVCVYVCACICICVLYMCMYMCVCVYCMHTCMYVCVYACVYVVCVYFGDGASNVLFVYDT